MDIPFVDVDENIVARKGMWETEIFKKKGEQYYRKLEKKVVKDLPRGFIISVGGGTVLDNDNLAHLKKIGKLIYIKRNLNDLKKFNFYRRPLINSKEDLEKMYKERKKIYEKVSD